MSHARLICADVTAGLKTLSAESIDCVVTSCLFYGLRDYQTARWEGGSTECSHVATRGSQGTTGVRKDRTFTARVIYRGQCGKCGALRIDQQIGLEDSPADYLKRLVLVFREVRRVLSKTGTAWINMGDSFCSDAGVDRSPTTKPGKRVPSGWTNRAQPNRVHYLRSGGDKDPKRLPSAATAVRSGVIGAKPKDLMMMPHRLAIALQNDGWWVRGDIVWAKPAPMPESVTDRPTRSHEYIFLLSKSPNYYYDHEAIKEPAVSGHPSGNGYKRSSRLSYKDDNGSRGSDKPWAPVSTIDRNQASLPVHGNLPGRSDHGKACNNEGQAFRNKRDVWFINSEPFADAHFAVFPRALVDPCILAGCPPGGTVLDPFAGSGTTGCVALARDRNFIGIELNPDYVAMARRRLESVGPLLHEVSA